MQTRKQKVHISNKPTIISKAEEIIAIETEVTSEVTQTLVTRLTSLASQKKSSQTQTDIFIDAFMQTESTPFSKMRDNTNQKNSFDSVEIQSDSLVKSTSKIPEICLNDNVLCYNELHTKTSLTFTNYQSINSINKPSTQINNSIEKETKETQTAATEYSMLTNTFGIANETAGTSLEQFTLSPCYCETKMKRLVKYSENSSQTEDVCDLSCSESENLNEMSICKTANGFKTAGDKLLNKSMHFDTGTSYMSKTKDIGNHKFRSFSKSLPINLDSLCCTSEGSSQTDFQFQAVLRPIHLFGSVLRTVYPSPMATLLTPLGNFLFFIISCLK